MTSEEIEKIRAWLDELDQFPNNGFGIGNSDAKKLSAIARAALIVANDPDLDPQVGHPNHPLDNLEAALTALVSPYD